MAEGRHPMAGEHLPHFIVTPGESDQLFILMVIFLILVIGGVGVLYFRLHALPEKMAHRGESTQFQLVGVLSLLALFTHNNLFWVAALLLAALKMPDISTPLSSIASSLGRAAEARRSEPRPEPSSGVPAPHTAVEKPADNGSSQAISRATEAPAQTAEPEERRDV
ncbi:MAG: hypothetical protein AAF577_04275 [Pseudomonadota bacterium]